jgi:hypothetical protein
MPGPRGEQLYAPLLAVCMAIRYQGRFRDTGAAKHIGNDRSCSFSRDMETLFDTPVEPVLPVPARHGQGREGKRLARHGIEAFHGYADQFTSDIDAAPEKGELRDAFADRLTGSGKQIRGQGKKLGGGHCSAFNLLAKKGDKYGGGMVRPEYVC